MLVTTSIACGALLCSNWEKIVQAVAVRNDNVVHTPVVSPDDNTPLLVGQQLLSLADNQD